MIRMLLGTPHVVGFMTSKNETAFSISLSTPHFLVEEEFIIREVDIHSYKSVFFYMGGIAGSPTLIVARDTRKDSLYYLLDMCCVNYTFEDVMRCWDDAVLEDVVIKESGT